MEMDEQNKEEIEELNLLDYLDALGLNDVKIKKHLGRDRGPSPTVSESQQKSIEKLASKLIFKSPNNNINNNLNIDKSEDYEERFDILSKPRVIIYEGKVLKKSINSVVQHNSRRHLYLLNDVLMITSLQSNNLSYSQSEDDICAFEINSTERPFTFIAESESDKRIWLEEIESAIFALKLSNSKPLKPGWIHEVIRGTIFSSAYHGELESLKVIIKHSNNSIIDLHDDCDMCSLHWAALEGHVEIVEYLLDYGANVNELNQGLNSALMLAASRGHDHIVMLLKNRGADIFIRNLKDRDALYMAVLYAHRSRGLPNIIQSLTSGGVGLNEIDATGSAPIHECASRNLSRPVLLLVDAGANVNITHSRNGLTPLQMACSANFLDVETVRALLDKGAYPNWKDASRRSAFDMVLISHSARFNGQKALRLQTSNSQGLKSTLDEVSSFVQDALPVLMELVKKGGKYTEESLATLRPSFREAIDSARLHWINQTQPAYFLEFAIAKGEEFLSSSDWISDSSSKFCLLCLEKFNYSSRRHHCRCCGTLCCDSCSSKRLIIRPTKIPNYSPKKSINVSTNSDVSTPKNDKYEERVCDGCFNKLIYESWIRQQDVMKAKKDLDKQEALDKLKYENEIINNNTNESSNHAAKALLMADANISSSSTTPTNSNRKNTITFPQTLTATGEAMDALQERGVKLQNTVEKAEELKDNATLFNNAAKSLLQQQQRKASVWGIK
eukprot:gene17308-22849_t